jgi:hypothetical protein
MQMKETVRGNQKIAELGLVDQYLCLIISSSLRRFIASPLHPFIASSLHRFISSLPHFFSTFTLFVYKTNHPS